MSIDELIRALLILRAEVGDTGIVKARIKGKSDEIVMSVTDAHHGVGEQKETFVMLELNP